mgnify:CR=1 FL=1
MLSFSLTDTLHPSEKKSLRNSLARRGFKIPFKRDSTVLITKGKRKKIYSEDYFLTIFGHPLTPGSGYL